MKLQCVSMSPILLMGLASAQEIQVSALPGGGAAERGWILCLRDSGTDKRRLFREIQAAPQADRQNLVDALAARAEADHAAVSAAVSGVGGAVRQHYWTIDAMWVDVDPAGLPELRRHPRVESAWPVRSYGVHDVSRRANPSAAPSGALIAPRPMTHSGDAANHNIAAAWGILGGSGAPYRGAGARIAIFDTGIDRDIDHQNSGDTPHPAFLVAGSSTSRIEAHLVPGTANHVDINLLGPNPPYVVSSPQSSDGYIHGTHHTNAGHGTAMAAVAAGNTYGPPPGGGPYFAANGHAPDSAIVDVPCLVFQGSAAQPWVVTDNSYLDAIQELQTHILMSRSRVHVANISVAGSPSPDHPVSLAFDTLASENDILLVTSAGNTGDTAINSHGFFHGLAVGAVHARVAGDVGNLAFVPLPETARGPLPNNKRGRFYPDVCATGAGTGAPVGSGWEFVYPGTIATNTNGSMVMPGVDLLTGTAIAGYPTAPVNHMSPLRYNLGTSAASAQVAGAAALYRGRVQSASADETRAAILLSVIGTYSDRTGQSSSPAVQDAYHGRNTFGTGYVRDDLLAQFAVRDPAAEPLVSVLTLGPSRTVASTQYTGLTPGTRYVVVACWQRLLGTTVAGVANPLPDIDLRIVDVANGLAIASSATPANSYERVVFVAPSSGHVKIELSGDVQANLKVQVAARRLPADVDPATSNPADHVLAASGEVSHVSAGSGAGCVGTDRDWSVDRILPTAYEDVDAYGSAPFSKQPAPGSTINWVHTGYGGGQSLWSTNTGITYMHFQYENVVGSMMIRGLAFRTWSPIYQANSASVTLSFYVEQRPSAVSPGPAMLPSSSSSPIATVVLPPNALAKDWTPNGRHEFNLVVPFTSPFSYSTAQPTPTSPIPPTTLHIWVKRVGSSAGSAFKVDSTNDGFGSPYGSQTIYPNTSGGTVQYTVQDHFGQVPVIGLIEDSAPQIRELRLTLLGEPWSNAPSEPERWMDALCFTGTPQAACLVAFGELGSATAGAPCSVMLSSLIGQLPPVIADSAGICRLPIKIMPGLVGLEFALQGFVLPGAPISMTNAVRIKVGGAL
jgi:hypothetical protein